MLTCKEASRFHPVTPKWNRNVFEKSKKGGWSRVCRESINLVETLVILVNTKERRLLF